MNIIETSPTLISSPNSAIPATSSFTPPAGALTLYLLRNGNAYQAAVADENGNLVASASVANYASKILEADRLFKRGFVLAPNDSSSSSDFLVGVDNYEYFK